MGVNHELIELHNNFPRFHILHKKGLSEEDILSKVKEKGALILENLKKLRAKNDHLLLSKEEAIKSEDLFVDNIPSPKECLAENESNPTKLTPKHVDSTTSNRSEEIESRFDNVIESEDECNHCALTVDYPYPIKGDDKIYINRRIGEVLLFPSDESQDENWIQDCVINRRSDDRREDSVLYSKSDSLKLEQFLRREQEGSVTIIKRKCLDHSKPCLLYTSPSPRDLP